MTDNINLSNIQIHCNGFRNLKLCTKPADNGIIPANQVSWDMVISINNDPEKARRLYYDFCDRLKAIAKGTADETLNIISAGARLTSSQIKRMDELYEYGFRASVYCHLGVDPAMHSTDYVVREEDFVREFHEELRCYEDCHITDDKHWSLFERTGKVTSSETVETSSQETYPKNGYYDKGDSNMFHMTSASFYKIATYVLLIIVAIMAFLLL